MKAIVGLFTTIREAESAIVDLIDSRFERTSISIMAVEDKRREFMSGTPGYPGSGWMDLTILPVEKRSLTEIGLPDEDAEFFVEGVNGGGFVVTVTAEDFLGEFATEIMRRHGTVDAEIGRHFKGTYGQLGERFGEPYWSAYHFAESESSSHPQFRGKQWPEVEEELHKDWEESHPGTWTRVQEAIHFAWDRTMRH